MNAAGRRRARNPGARCRKLCPNDVIWDRTQDNFALIPRPHGIGKVRVNKTGKLFCEQSLRDFWQPVWFLACAFEVVVGCWYFIDARAENELIVQAVIARIPGFRWSPWPIARAKVDSIAFGFLFRVPYAHIRAWWSGATTWHEAIAGVAF